MRAKPQPQNAPKKNLGEDHSEERLVRLMIRDRDTALAVLKIASASCFANEVCKKIVEAIQRIFEKNAELNISEITSAMEEEYVQQAYELFAADVETNDLMGEGVAYAKKVRQHARLRYIKELQAQANQYIVQGKFGDPECQRLLKKIESLKKEPN